MLCLLVACRGPEPLHVDLLIENGLVHVGDNTPPIKAKIAVSDDKIVYIGSDPNIRIRAQRTIDATGKLVAPGFIDPHTHSLNDLLSTERNANLNYLMQGVTTVFNGNDGEGPIKIAELSERLGSTGIGTNVAFFVGHGTIREEVMGRENRAPSDTELAEMESLVESAMREGALGLSTGLYYAPGSFSETDEVISLARVTASFDGVYDTHLRDESSYNIGLLGAVEETLRIGRESGIHLHFAHIKALGVDVWGQSTDVIELIEKAQQAGLSITADQYPWRASGTHIGNALIPRWVMGGGQEQYRQRLQDKTLLPEIKNSMRENLRKRGGAGALLIVQAPDPSMNGKTLAEVAESKRLNPVDSAIEIALQGRTRVASFNMDPEDIKNFMQRGWVMTSSDGTDGHPRKYASFPKKYREFVVQQELLTPETFIHRSAGLAADTFKLDRRGYLREGYYADIIIFDPERYSPTADFQTWNRLSEGVDYVLVNGEIAVSQGRYREQLAGRVLFRKDSSAGE